MSTSYFSRPRLPSLAVMVLGVLAAPWFLQSNAQHTFLAQSGIAILCCAGFALLLGQGGLLSFGHALYFGAGAFGVAWVWPWLQAQGWGHAAALVLMPLVGGLVALALALLLGVWLARLSGAGFAMLTLALAELAWALAQTWPTLFGGEAGLSLDRTALAWAGPRFASSFQITLLISAYTALGLGFAAWLGLTPFALALNAVRDNAARAQSLGLAPQALRYRALAFSALLCGVAGGLFALFYEHVSTEVLGAQRSGMLMLFAIVGGVRHRSGPVLGGLLMVLAMSWLSHFTAAWMLYVGALFCCVVLWAPQGLAAWWAGQAQRCQQAGWRTYARETLARLGAGLLVFLGAAALVEMAYRGQERALLGSAGTEPQGVWWVGALAACVLCAGLWGLRHARSAKGAVCKR